MLLLLLLLFFLSAVLYCAVHVADVTGLWWCIESDCSRNEVFSRFYLGVVIDSKLSKTTV